MRISDVDIRAFESATRRGRSRSPDIQQLVDTIQNLSPRQAKGVMLAPGDAPAKVRSRLIYAARLAGKTLQVAIEDDRVLFALSTRRPRGKSKNRA